MTFAATTVGCRPVTICRALLIAAGYPEGNDGNALKSDPVFNDGGRRRPESGADLLLACRSRSSAG
jgi:hypothetical protein